MAIDFGVFVPQGWRMDLIGITDPVEQFEAMTSVAKAADTGEWDSIWVYDHFHTVPEPTMNSVFESLTSTMSLVRDTEKVNVGQMVNCNGYRQPSLFAKMMSTIDVASHGRLYAGFGAGWYEHEWRAYGYGFPETKERMARFREATEIIHKMWTEDEPTFAGTYYSIDKPINEPKSHKPGYKVPLWIGGGGPRVTLKLVAKYGDACNVGPDVAEEKLEILKGHCDKVGRNYDEIRKSTSLNIYPIAAGADPEAATAAVRKQYNDQSFAEFSKSNFVAEPDALVERIQELQSKGLDYFILYIPGVAYDHEPIQLVASEVLKKVSG